MNGHYKSLDGNKHAQIFANESFFATAYPMEHKRSDRIPSDTPGAEPPRDAKDSGSARSHATHIETSSSNRP